MTKDYKNIVGNIEEVFQEFSLDSTNHQKIAVAVSGGSDSLALLFAISDFYKNKNSKVIALTIDHKVRKNSSSEAKEVGKMLKKFKIEHKIFAIPQSKIPTSNIESGLRERRYEILTNFCNQNKIKFIFVGHHLGDIAENFLIRLFRGSGLDGLSPIQKISEKNGVKIIRPFLNISKTELQDFLKSKNIKWFEDESNEDEKFLRNKIRKFLASFDDRNIIENRIKNASLEIAKTRDFFDIIMRDKESSLIEKCGDYFIVNRKNLREENPLIATKILVLLLIKISNKSYKPRKEKLLRFYNYLIADGKIKKREFYGCVAEDFSVEKAKIYKKFINS